jgi:hypothetical protein
MQDSFVENFSSCAAKIIVDYFELTSLLKKRENSLSLFKEINSIPISSKQIKLKFFDEMISRFSIRIGHQVSTFLTRRRWLNEDSGQVVFGPINCGRNLVTDGTRVT